MCNQTITLGGESVPYTVNKSSRARRVSITVGHDGALSVILPRRVSFARAGLFLKEKASWIIRARERIAKRIAPAPLVTPAFSAAHKHAAKRLISERVAHFNRYYQFTFGRISVRNQKTRWGSCSSGKNLQFNYRLIFLPPHLLDYVVAHELCHLAEANHGARFRALLAQTVPEHCAHERQLRRYRIS